MLQKYFSEIQIINKKIKNTVCLLDFQNTDPLQPERISSIHDDAVFA